MHRTIRVSLATLSLALFGAFLILTSAACGGGGGGGGTPPSTTPTVTSVAPSSGTNAGGTPVTITGTNFSAPATVDIGGAPATGVVVVNATTITCVTPAGAVGPADVAVTTPDGTGTLSMGYTYLFPPPTISSVAPNVGATSGGMHHVITGTGFTANAAGANTVTVGGNPALNVVTVNDTTITCDSPPNPAPGTTTVGVTNNNGTVMSPFSYFDPIWAAEGGGGVTPPAVHNFYAIDPATGIAYLIGPIGFGVTGMFYVGPTQILWATTAPGQVAMGVRDLITINPMTGVGTLVGPTDDAGMVNHLLRDVTFDTVGGFPYGTDPCTWVTFSAAGLVGPPIGAGVPVCGPGGGLAADAPSATFYFMMGNTNPLYTVAPATGVFTPGPVLSGGALAGGHMNSATFHAGMLYTVESDGNALGNRQLHTVNTATGVLTPVGPPLPAQTDAIVSPRR